MAEVDRKCIIINESFFLDNCTWQELTLPMTRTRTSSRNVGKIRNAVIKKEKLSSSIGATEKSLHCIIIVRECQNLV